MYRENYTQKEKELIAIYDNNNSGILFSNHTIQRELTDSELLFVLSVKVNKLLADDIVKTNQIKSLQEEIKTIRRGLDGIVKNYIC